MLSGVDTGNNMPGIMKGPAFEPSPTPVSLLSTHEFPALSGEHLGSQPLAMLAHIPQALPPSIHTKVSPGHCDHATGLAVPSLMFHLEPRACVHTASLHQPTQRAPAHTDKPCLSVVALGHRLGRRPAPACCNNSGPSQGRPIAFTR